MEEEQQERFVVGDLVDYEGQRTAIVGPLKSRQLYRPRWKVPQYRPCHELSLRDKNGRPIYAEPWELTKR